MKDYNNVNTSSTSLTIDGVVYSKYAPNQNQTNPLSVERFDELVGLIISAKDTQNATTDKALADALDDAREVFEIVGID